MTPARLCQSPTFRGVARSQPRGRAGVRGLSLLFALAIAVVATSGRAEAPTAPLPIQAQLVVRLLPFERGFGARAKDGVGVLVLEKQGNAESGNAARVLQNELSKIGRAGGKPMRVQTHVYAGTAELAALCRDSKVYVVFITPGFANEAKSIGDALAGVPVLTAAAVEAYVPLGIVLGVELLEGKSHMSINLARAKAQRLDFPSSVLKLAKVYR
jgi:hypothetical protein